MHPQTSKRGYTNPAIATLTDLPETDSQVNTQEQGAGPLHPRPEIVKLAFPTPSCIHIHAEQVNMHPQMPVRGCTNPAIATLTDKPEMDSQVNTQA